MLKPLFSVFLRFSKRHLIASTVAMAALVSSAIPNLPARADPAAAQSAVLYDEDPSNPKGNQFAGSVNWSIERFTAAGQEPDIEVQAYVDIPDRKLKIKMSFRRNTDKSLAASHLVVIRFSLPPDFDNVGIADVPGILMKLDEQSRATPLAGIAVKAADGFFLVGLSNGDADLLKNTQLLKERSLIDIPIVYQNKRRAILRLDKGQSGEAAFAQAFAAWAQSPSKAPAPNAGSPNGGAQK